MCKKATNNNELPTVSIIILNYNGKRYLDGCFNSIKKISYPQECYEVIMVDNCSTDGSISYVNDNYSWVKTIPLKKNYGFTGGNNLGVKSAKGEYVVLLNNDVVVTEDWLIELVKMIFLNPNFITTSKLFFLDNPEIVNYAGSKGTLIGRGFSNNCGKKDTERNCRPKAVLQPYGASMLIRKSIYEELGGFDEDYFTSLEDLDLGLRAWLYGYEVIYVPTSVVYHMAGGTTGRGSRTINPMIFHSTKNSYLNILKCYDLKHVFLGVTFSLAYYAEMAIWLTLKTGKLDAIKLILKSHFWIIRNFGKIVLKRSVIQKNRKIKYCILFKEDFFASFNEMFLAHGYLRTLLERL